jgi:hypothetical protein
MRAWIALSTALVGLAAGRADLKVRTTGVAADLKVRTTRVAADLKVRTTRVAADLKVRTTGVAADLKVRTTRVVQAVAPNATLTAVPGIKVGHHTLTARPTGCTVVLIEGGATAGVDVRGAAPATRDTDLLATAVIRAATQATGLPNLAVRDLR